MTVALELVESALDAIALASPSGDELAVAGSLVAWARDQGLDATTEEVGPGRRNVLVSLDHGPGPHLLFSGHLDTLPPHPTSHAVGLREGRYYAPEVTNMKAAVAAMVAAMAGAVGAPGLRGRVTLLAASSECDTIGLGTTHALSRGLTADLAVNGEPTDLVVLAGHAGVARFRIEAAGVSAHISQVGMGRNAVEGLVRALHGLDAGALGAEPDADFPGLPLLNIGVVEGGIAPGMLAVQAHADLDIRWHPGMTREGIHRALEAHVEAQGMGGMVRVVSLTAPEFLQPAPYVATRSPRAVDVVRAAVSRLTGEDRAPEFLVPQIYYGSDAPHLVAAGIPTCVFGPGKAQDVNRPDESMAWPDVLRATAVYAAVVSNVLGSG